MSHISFPRAVLFDWDDTLVDTEVGTFHAINSVLTAFNHQPWQWEEFCQQPALSIRDYFHRIFPVHQVSQAEDLYRQHASNLPIHPFPYAQPLLDWLKSRGISMGVVSNKEGNILRREVSHLGWGHYFHSVIGSYDTEEDKPSPRPLLHALAQQSLTAGPHVWFIGDSVVDMVCAHHAGCTPISISQQAHDSLLSKACAEGCHGVYQLLKELSSKD